jgi:hypothetical protein
MESYRGGIKLSRFNCNLDLFDLNYVFSMQSTLSKYQSELENIRIKKEKPNLRKFAENPQLLKELS